MLLIFMIIHAVSVIIVSILVSSVLIIVQNYCTNFELNEANILEYMGILSVNHKQKIKLKNIHVIDF